MLYGLEAFDWTLSNKESRLVLYRFFLNLEQNGLINRKRFIAQAFADYDGSYDGFDDGFKKGKAGSTKLGMIAREIGSQFPERVPILIEQLQPVWPHESNHDYWDRFLELNGSFSNVEVFKSDDNGLNITTFANREPLADQRIKLGESFHFELDSPIAGQVFALQCVNHAWFKLPLSRQQSVIPINTGKHVIPVDLETVEPDSYCEEHNTGLHKYVFVVAETELSMIADRISVSEPIQRKELMQLAFDIVDLDAEWEMFLINVLFVQ